MLVDCRLKRVVDFAQAMLENLGEADQNRQIDAAQLQPIDQLLQIDRALGILRRVDANVPLVVDREVSVAPAATSYSSAASMTDQRSKSKSIFNSVFLVYRIEKSEIKKPKAKIRKRPLSQRVCPARRNYAEKTGGRFYRCDLCSTNQIDYF